MLSEGVGGNRQNVPGLGVYGGRYLPSVYIWEEQNRGPNRLPYACYQHLNLPTPQY